MSISEYKYLCSAVGYFEGVILSLLNYSTQSTPKTPTCPFITKYTEGTDK